MVQEMKFKDISFVNSGSHFDQEGGIFLCNFDRGHNEDYFFEVFCIWAFRMRYRLGFFLALVAILFNVKEPFVHFW